MSIKHPTLILLMLCSSIASAAEPAGSEDQPTMVVNKVHAGEIKNLIYSPDGKFLVSGNSIGEVTIWDIRTRLPVRTWQACIHGLWWLAVSPDSRSLVTACAKGSNVAVKDGGVKVWDMETGKVRLEPEAGDGVRQVACLPNGLLVAPDYEGRIGFFDMVTGKKVRSLKRTFSSKAHDGIITGMQVYQDGRVLASWSESSEYEKGDGKVRVWDTASGDLICAEDLPIRYDSNNCFTKEYVPLYKEYMWSGASHPQSQQFAHDPKAERPVGATAMVRGEYIYLPGPPNREDKLGRKIDVPAAASFSPDGVSLAVGSDNGVTIWNLASAGLGAFIPVGKRVVGVDWSPDGRYIVAGVAYKPGEYKDDKHQLKVYESASLKEVASYDEGRITAVKRMPDGVAVFTSMVYPDSWNDPPIDAVSLRSQKDMYKYDPKRNYKIGRVWQPFLTPDGSRIAYSWHMGPKADPDEMTRVTFSDYKVPPSYGSVTKDEAGNVTSWTVVTGRAKSVDSIHAFALSPDGRVLAGGSDAGVIHLLSSADGSEIKRIAVGDSRARSDSFANQITGIAFSRDGKTIITCGADHATRIWDVGTGKLLKTTAMTTTVKSLVPSPDGRLLAAVLKDGRTTVIDPATGEEIAGLVSEGTDWLVATPDGYFDASQNGGSLVAMSKGLAVFGVDQFALRTNRPDVIVKRLGFPGQDDRIAYMYGQYKRRLARAGFTEEQLAETYKLPEAAIASVKQNGNIVDLQFTLKSADTPLKSYNVYVNDVPVYGAAGKTVGGSDQALSEKIELTAGMNKIEVTCTNEKGAESYRAMATAKGTGLPGTLYYIGFGVSKYKDTSLDLKYADKDARDLADTFAKMTGKGFKQVVSKVYLNEEVNSANIAAAKKMLQGGAVGDTVVVFIAGHGVHDSDAAATYYFLTYGVDTKNLSGTAANFEAIEDLLQGIPPRNKLFLMDTCESGEKDETAERNVLASAQSRGLSSRGLRSSSAATAQSGDAAKPVKDRSYLLDKSRYIYNDLTRRSGAIVFSSSKGGELSYESDAIKNGFFTNGIMDGLKGKAGIGTVSTDQLRDFVTKEVGQKTGGMQNPTVDRDNIYVKFGFPVVQ